MKITVRPEGDVPNAEPLPGHENLQEPESMPSPLKKREERRRQLWRELRAIRGLANLKAFYTEIGRLESLTRRPVAREDLCCLRLECITALLNESEDNPEAAQDILIDFLLPICLRPRRDVPLETWKKMLRHRSKPSASKQAFTDVGSYWSWREAHEAREKLADWFRTRSSLQRKTTRQSLLKVIHATLFSALRDFDALAQNKPFPSPFHVAPFERDDSETAPLTRRFHRVHAAIACIIAIGYRDTVTDALLGELMERDDSIGSLALGALASLGVPPQYTTRVQEVLRRQVHSRPQAHIGYAFQELADGSQFDGAQLLLERSVHHSIEVALSASERASRSKEPSAPESKQERIRHLRDTETELNASLIQVFLERHPQSGYWHDRMWNVAWTLHRSLAALMGEAHATFLGSGGKFLACNSPWMARDILMYLIPAFGEDPGDEHHAGSDFLRGLALENLEKCVQPRVLWGLDNVLMGVPTAGSSASTEADNLEVVLPWLKKDVTFNTHYENDTDNSLRRLKRRAWRLLLSLGIIPPVAWLRAAFENEGSGHMRGDICQIAAHLRMSILPESLYKLTRETVDVPRQPPYSEFLSRMGVQRLLASASSRPAFDALLNAGFTMGGNLMMATINHLGECAYWLHQEGDTQVVSDLIRHAEHASVSCQREAAIGAVRLLAMRGCVGSAHLPDLLQLARFDELQELPAYTRATLVETLGYVVVPTHDHERVRALLTEIFESFSPIDYPEQRRRGEHDLGWYAAESLIKLGFWKSLRVEVLQRLGLEEVEGRLSLRSDGITALNNRAATVLGMLWQHERASPDEPWSMVIAQVITQGSLGSLAPLLNVIVHTSRDGEELVAEPKRALLAGALVGRIRKRQSNTRAETSLFEPLAALSPAGLIQPVWEREWRDWLPDARVALAEAIGTLPDSVFGDTQSPLLNRALEILRSLMGDGLYAVRRSAYRVLRKRRPSTLWLTCIDWANDADPELRQRGAECAAWLPAEIDQMLDPRLLRSLVMEVTGVQQITPAERDATVNSFTPPEPGNSFASPELEIQTLLQFFMHDREQEVRSAAKRSIKERRNRQLADEYLQIIEHALSSAAINRSRAAEHAVESSNNAVLSAYQYSRALIHVGQDDHLQRLSQLAQRETIPPHMRFWIQELLEPLAANWKTVTNKWPQPWLPWEGDIEEVDGFVWTNNRQFRARFSLWHRPAVTSHEYADWGGAIMPRRKTDDPDLLLLGEESAHDLSSLSLLMAEHMEMEIPGRPRTQIHATHTSTNRPTLIRSNEPYPAEEVQSRPE